MTSQPSGCPSTQPIGQLLRGSPVLSGEGVRSDRSQLLCFQWIYERTGARHALFRLRTLVEARSAPGDASLGHRASFKSADQPGSSSAARSAGRRPMRSIGVAVAEVAPGRDDGGHAGGAAGLHVAQVVADVDAALRAPRPAGAPPRAAARDAAWHAASCRRRPAPPRARRRPSPATSGSVKRVALLVTMPQGRPRALERRRAPARMSSNTGVSRVMRAS